MNQVVLSVEIAPYIAKATSTESSRKTITILIDAGEKNHLTKFKAIHYKTLSIRFLKKNLQWVKKNLFNKYCWNNKYLLIKKNLKPLIP